MYTNSENQRGAHSHISVSLCNGICGAVHGLIQFAGCIIALAGMNCGNVEPNVYPPAMDITEIAVLHSPAQISLEDDLAEDRIQANLISSVWRCGEADQLLRAKVIKDLPVCAGSCVMGLVADNETEVLRIEVAQTARQRLNAGTDNLLAVTVLLCTFNAIGAVEVFARLLHQFFTVGQDQHSLPVPGDIRKSNCFSEACCHLGEERTRRLRLDGFNTFGLIWP